MSGFVFAPFSGHDSTRLKALTKTLNRFYLKGWAAKEQRPTSGFRQKSTGGISAATKNKKKTFHSIVFHQEFTNKSNLISIFFFQNRYFFLKKMIFGAQAGKQSDVCLPTCAPILQKFVCLLARRASRQTTPALKTPDNSSKFGTYIARDCDPNIVLNMFEIHIENSGFWEGNFTQIPGVRRGYLKSPRAAHRSGGRSEVRSAERRPEGTACCPKGLSKSPNG